MANKIPAEKDSLSLMEQNENAPQSALVSLGLGPTEVILSSSYSHWDGALVERHRYLPGERNCGHIAKHVISVFHDRPSRLEYRNALGEFVPVWIRPGTIMTTPPGALPIVRLATETEVTHCALEDSFLHKVANELGRPAGAPGFRLSIHDKPLRNIVIMLTDELQTNRQVGRPYVDSLIFALATRYLFLHAGETCRSRSQIVGLVPRALRRVRAKIEANLDADLTLESLAQETGYSRAHFLRMFRAATGLTPHQYILDLRLKRAQERLREETASIVDVALSCGFSSQSHMTTVFRRHLRTTPGEFLRNT
ncbi:MAG: helix-turn-helix transcriptional regulator [Acidobacteriaceae bacterium]|nr:helix-turn-helix transcriptional regulator [Acidobacteriaceae bacterium]